MWLDIKILFKTVLKVFKKADIVEQDKTKQAYYYGDYLLESGVVTEEEYKTKQALAKDLIEKTKKPNKKKSKV